MKPIIFELKEEHIKLLKNLRWNMKENIVVGVSKDEEDEYSLPFNEQNLYEAIDLVLNGKPENLDILTTDEPKYYTNEQILEWDKLYSELPMALDIILYRGSFELGTFKTKWYDRDWKKIN